MHERKYSSNVGLDKEEECPPTCMHLTAQGTHTHTHHADTSNCGSWSWLNGNAVVSMWLKPKQWSSVWHNVNSWEAHEYGGVCKAKPRYQQKDFQWNTAQKHTWQYERRVRFNVISLHGARRAQQEHQELSMCLALENKLIKRWTGMSLKRRGHPRQRWLHGKTERAPA